MSPKHLFFPPLDKLLVRTIPCKNAITKFMVFPYLIIFLISGLRLIYAVNLDILPDEAYYWEWSRNLDSSFYDQGPGVAFYIRCFTSLFGNNIFALKFASIFASAISLWIIYLTGEQLNFSKTKKVLMFGIFIFMPAFFSGSLVIMHDTCLILFWMIALFFSIKYIHSHKSLDLYVTFIAMGLGFLSKHTMVFFAASLIIWLLISPEEYKLLKNKHFYIAFALAFGIISPMILWNVRHNWDNIDAIIHLRSAGGAEYEGSNMDTFIAGQMIAISPIWFFAILLIAVSSAYAGIRSLKSKKPIFIMAGSSEPYSSAMKLLTINALILPIFFLFLSSKKMVQANWTFPSYPAMILVVVGLFPETAITGKEKTLRRLIFSGFIFALAMDVFFLFPQAISGIVKLKGSSFSNPIERYKGYKEAIFEIEKLQKEKHSGSTLVANRYQDASIASWYLSGKPFIQSINILQKNQYTYWNKMEKGKDYMLFYIQENTCEKSFVFFQPLLESMFEEVTEYPEKEILMNGVAVKRYQVWHGKNYKQDWATSFFASLNDQLLFIHSQGLVGEESGGNSKSQKKLIQAVQNYLLSKGEINCSTF
ncbi:MAG: glycosyltransferase family 39 protein [Leptospiraceae bacterium]|nr:glycosyltransferase family 39 protein [Leptospiraceae bacterium]